MGVIALGIGFATPLALAGVAIHIAGHAVAKALGFYAATPLLAHEPRAAGHAVTGIARTQPALGTAMGISLGTLAGLPPSPLFLSEVLIVAGGFEAGWTLGRGRRDAPARARLRRPRPRAARDDRRQGAPPRRRDRSPGFASLTPLTAVVGVLLLALTRRRALARRAPTSSTRSPRGSREHRPHTEAYRVPEHRRARARRRLALRRAPRLARTARWCERSSSTPTGRRGSRRSARRAGEASSIVDLAPAAGWDEREAHDLYGVDFQRPRAAAAARRPRRSTSTAWTVPVRRPRRPTRSRSGRSTPG